MLCRSLLLAICAMAAGCAIEPTKLDPCAGWEMICPSRKDTLTDGTSKQILAHDEHGKALGCWSSCRAPKPKP